MAAYPECVGKYQPFLLIRGKMLALILSLNIRIFKYPVHINLHLSLDRPIIFNTFLKEQNTNSGKVEYRYDLPVIQVNLRKGSLCHYKN